MKTILTDFFFLLIFITNCLIIKSADDSRNAEVSNYEFIFFESDDDELKKILINHLTELMNLSKNIKLDGIDDFNSKISEFLDGIKNNSSITTVVAINPNIMQTQNVLSLRESSELFLNSIFNRFVCQLKSIFEKYDLKLLISRLEEIVKSLHNDIESIKFVGPNVSFIQDPFVKADEET